MNTKQAFLMGATAIVESTRDLGRHISNSNRELGEKLESISKAEIASRDRVDISLKEYESMKRQIESLTWERDRLRSVLENIKAPLDKNIIPGSINTYYYDDPMNCKRIYRVEFEIDDMEMRR
mgnify:CR=1 FL=1|nr:MAG TPA: hypothetical protein [Bacteriophage sp.]